jgi:hypothetical protein
LGLNIAVNKNGLTIRDVVKSFGAEEIDQDVILYNKIHLTYQSGLSERTLSAYPSAPGRPVQNVYFSRQDGSDLQAGFSDFRLHSPWQTNIDPYTKESKAIDHFFVIGPGSSRDLLPDEVLIGRNLQETIDLMNLCGTLSEGLDM